MKPREPTHSAFITQLYNKSNMSPNLITNSALLTILPKLCPCIQVTLPCTLEMFVFISYSGITVIRPAYLQFIDTNILNQLIQLHTCISEGLLSRIIACGSLQSVRLGSRIIYIIFFLMRIQFSVTFMRFRK
jgi:hypothetical protein